MKHFLKATITLICVITATSALFYSLPSAYAQNEIEQLQLTVGGLVKSPLNVTFSEIQNMPETSVQATIYCVDFPTVVVASGEWKGVSLAFLLEKAGVSSTAVKVGFFASDGYSTDLELSVALSGDVVVAYEKDGLPLDEILRLVVPGKWGYKWISQLTSIVVFDYDYKGKWESQGYSDDANVQSSIFRPSFPSASDVPIPPQPTETPAPFESPIPNSNSSSSDSSASPQTQEAADPEPQIQSIDFLQTIVISLLLLSVFASLFLVFRIRRRRGSSQSDSQLFRL